MKRKLLGSGIVLLLLAANFSICLADEDTGDRDRTYAVRTECVPAGPEETYVYKNDHGKFVLNKDDAGGTAEYRWQGQGREHRDTLEFVGRTVVRDGTIGTDADVDGWLYKGTDGSGNEWWLFFGEKKLRGCRHSAPNHYPIYYSFQDPSEEKFKRWLTRSGTLRL